MLKDSCYYCGLEIEMPFECNYCKDKFCSEHRLPENHRCVKLHSIRAKRFGDRRVIRGKGIGRNDNILKKLGRKFKK